MLKLYKIYTKIIITIFVILFFAILIESYIFFKDIYINELMSLNTYSQEKIKNFNLAFIEYTLIVTITFLILIFLYFISVTNINKKLEKELNKIIIFLKNLTNEQKAQTITSTFSKEFYKITHLLSTISSILYKKHQKQSKYLSDLQNSIQQKDEILSAISHEFKNPIAIINGYCDTLINTENIPKNTQIKFLSKIKKNGEKLTNLIDKLRLSTKLENENTIEQKNIKLNPLVKSCIEDIQETHKREIILIENFEPLIQADETLLSIAIINLIENGIKYSEDKVTIIINKHSLHIKDNGIGIKDEDKFKILNKFYRVDNNWNNSLGLGLFIVSKILKMHNFRLKIQSEYKKGSEFIIYF